MSDFGSDMRRDFPPPNSPRLSEAYSDGFDTGASIAVHVLSAKADALAAGVKPGSNSASGNLVVMLVQLRSEIETELRRYWETDADGGR